MTKAGESTVTFKDVAGLQEEKEELEEVVDFLKNPAKYTSLAQESERHHSCRPSGNRQDTACKGDRR